MATRTVSVELQAKVNGYVSGMKAATASTDAFIANQKKASLATSETMKKVSMYSGIAAVAIGYGAYKSVQAASALNESMNKSGVVFGANAKAVQAWSTTSSKAMGIGQQKALAAASSYGNLFTAFGVGKQASADMSMALVKLASDLASFNDTSPEEALAAIQSGLTGEMEPMKRYGAVLSEVRLKQQAFEMGLISSVKQGLDPATKATAAYALMMKDTATAHDDFIRTSGDLANASRTMAGEFEDAQAALGENLLPVMNKAVGGANALLSALNALPSGVSSVVLGLTGLGAAALFLVPKIMAAKTALAGMGAGARGAAKGAAVGTAAFMGLTIAAGVLAAKMSDGAPNTQSYAEGLMSVAKGAAPTGVALNQLGTDLGAFKINMNAVLNPNEWQSMSSGIGGVFSVLTGFDPSPVGNSTRQLQELDTALVDIASRDPGQAAAIFEALKTSADGTVYSVDQLRQVFPLYSAGASAAAGSTNQLSAAANKLASDATAAEEAMKSLQAFMAGGIKADAAITAWRGFTASLKENGSAWNSNSVAALANRDAIRQYISAAVDGGGNAADAIARVGKEMGLSAGKTQALGERILGVQGYAEALGATKASPTVTANTSVAGTKLGAVMGQLLKVGATNPSPTVNVKTTGASLGTILGQLADIRDKNVVITTTHRNVGSALGARAAGGPVAGRYPYLIGEQGPELFMPGATGFITPARQTRDYLARGGLIAGAFKKGGAVAAAQAAAAVKATKPAADAAVAAGGKAQKIYTNAHPKSAANAVARAKAANKPGKPAGPDTVDTFDVREESSGYSGMSPEEAAAQAAQSAAESLAQARKTVSDSFASSASITTFNLTQNAAAVDSLASAQSNLTKSSTDLALARRAADRAGSRARPEAIKALAEAQRLHAIATDAVVAAQIKESETRPTSENMLRSMSGRLSMMQTFAANLGTLKARGLHPNILQDILSAGLVDGSAMAAVLVGAGDLAGFNATQQAISDTSAQIGVFSTDLPGRATGGPVSANRPYLVGERGPELFIPAQSGSIVESASSSGAVGQMNITINAGMGTDPRELGKVVVAAIKKYERASGAVFAAA